MVFKFLHISDVHLDMPFTFFYNNNKSNIRRSDLLQVFRNAMNIAIQENVNAIFISGDLYEHNYVKQSTIMTINELFKNVMPIKIFIIAGNHDPYIKNSYYKNFNWSENVYIFNDETQSVVFEKEKIIVSGVSFFNFYHEQTLITKKLKINTNENYINILLLHGTLGMSFTKHQHNPIILSELLELNMDYVALGHFHNKIYDYFNAGSIFNPGSPEPLGFDEVGEHGVFIGEITILPTLKKLLNIKFIKTNKRAYVPVDIDISNLSNTSEIIEKVLEIISKKNCEDIFNVTLRGRREKNNNINVSQILDGVIDKVFFIKITDETLEKHDYNEIASEYGLKGLFVRKMLALIEQSSEDEKQILTNALNLGVEALENGKIEFNCEEYLCED